MMWQFGILYENSQNDHYGISSGFIYLVVPVSRQVFKGKFGPVCWGYELTQTLCEHKKSSCTVLQVVMWLLSSLSTVVKFLKESLAKSECGCQNNRADWFSLHCCQLQSYSPLVQWMQDLFNFHLLKAWLKCHIASMGLLTVWLPKCCMLHVADFSPTHIHWASVHTHLFSSFMFCLLGFVCSFFALVWKLNCCKSANLILQIINACLSCVYIAVR